MNTKLLHHTTAVLFSSIIFFGCAHKQAETELNEKITQETSVKSDKDLQAEASSLLEKANLTAQQKQQLLTLQKSTRDQLSSYHEQSLRLRSVLIKDLASSANKAEEIALIKKQLRSVENKRLSVLFEAIEKANMITGRNNPMNENIMNDFLDIHDRNL